MGREESRNELLQKWMGFLGSRDLTALRPCEMGEDIRVHVRTAVPLCNEMISSAGQEPHCHAVVRTTGTAASR